ncbi:hypothetical protein [Halovivax sp.]|uniref:hypothetical protein n=1 Tax=Halovivax sp. TaxID=1935978 RepID=UPI0025B94787|nr:hypothetical protein [Halovivax sp.]
MDPRAKSALLWGAVGFMTFAVLARGSIALGEGLLSLRGAALGALLVGAATAAVAYRFEHRVAAWSARRSSRADSIAADGPDDGTDE